MNKFYHVEENDGTFIEEIKYMLVSEKTILYSQAQTREKAQDDCDMVNESIN